MSRLHSGWKSRAVSSCASAALVLGLPCVGAQAPATTRPLPLLTTARQVHTLTPQQATLAFPVKLRGVVTYYDPDQDGHPALFVADRTGSIYVDMAPKPTLAVRAGSVVEVSGVSDPAGFAPIVGQIEGGPEADVIATGNSASLPKPRRVTLAFLLTGSEDGQWVSLEGVVHSVEFDGMHVVLTLATIEGTITAMSVKEDGADYVALVDSRVQIRAVASPLFSDKRELVGMRLLFPDFKTSIAIEEPAPADPFAAPLRPLGSLLQFVPGAALAHRVHVRGRVTLQWPGRKLCFQDGEDGLCVETTDRTALQEGDLVDVAGFQARENYLPTLSDATLRPVAGRPVVSPPKSISAEEGLNGQHDGDLVQIEGRLIGKTLVMNDPALLLASDGIAFPAVLPAPARGAEKTYDSHWIDGSKLRVTGVLSGIVDSRQTNRNEGELRLQSFQILLRSPGDVSVSETASWWTRQHSLTVLGSVVLATLSVLFWVIILRRRVEQQTLVIRRSEEKFRHLAQFDCLTGLAVRGVMHERLDQALEEARRKQTALTLFMMDVDNFKQINDTFGHAAGDQVLSAIGRRVLASVRETDTAARMGGDEFHRAARRSAQRP